MQFIQKLLGLGPEQQPIKQQQTVNRAVPQQHFDVERELFNVEKQESKMLQELAHLEQEAAKVHRNIKTLNIHTQTKEIQRQLRAVTEKKSQLDKLKAKIKTMRMNKTRLEVRRLHLNLKHQNDNANKFMLGMRTVHDKIKSTNPKEVEESLNDTDRLIKILSGEQQANELAAFRALLQDQAQRKQQNKEQQQQSIGDDYTSLHHRPSLNDIAPSKRTAGGLLSKNTMPQHIDSFFFDTLSQKNGVLAYSAEREIKEFKTRSPIEPIRKPSSAKVSHNNSPKNTEYQQKLTQNNVINRMM